MVFSVSPRVVISRVTDGGMMFGLVPPWMDPTVTTAMSLGDISRDTIVCRSSTTRAAITIGSTPKCGLAPCAPWPWMVTLKFREAA